MKIDTYTKLLHCALSLFVLTAAEHVVEETKGENKNPNTNNSLTAVIHLADFYHLSDDIGGIGDLISAFAPKDAANLAVTSKGFHRDHLTHYEKRLKKHGVSSVEIAEDPVKKMPGLVINGKPFGDLQDSDLLEILVKLGDANAQAELYPELCQSYKKDQNSEQLLALANQGYIPAQVLVAKGYANGQYGFDQNPKQLLDLAKKGWILAGVLVAKGYVNGQYGFTQSPNQLLDLANQGWRFAQCKVASGYANGLHGFTQSPRRLLDLAKKGWILAGVLVAEGYVRGQHGFDQSPNQLLALANQGWEHAQRYVAEGYARGQHGFTKDTNALQALASQGWESAQWLVGLGYGRGFDQDTNPLLALANQGWEYAQKLVTEGYEKGQYGFTKDTNQLLALLANQGWKYAQESVLRLYVGGEDGLAQQINMGELALAIKFRNNTLFHAYTKTLPMKERIMFLLYSLGIDEHAKLTYG